MNFGTSAGLYIDDPALIKECLLNNYQFLFKADMFTSNLSRFFGKNNILVAEGLEWKKSRKIITPSFTFDFLKENTKNITETTEEKLQSVKDCKNVDLKYLTESITSQSFMRIFFESDLSESLYEGKPLFYWIIEIVNQLNGQSREIYNFLFGEGFYKLGLRASDRKWNRIMKDVRKIFTDYIQEQKKNQNFSNKHLLANLIKNEDLLKEAGSADGVERITSEMLIMFVAGTNTTATCIRNALFMLSKNPETLNKLVEEIDQNIKDDNSIDYDVLSKLDYLTAVIKETMRIHGPGHVILTRVVDKTFRLGDFIIKKDTIINFPLISNYHDPKYFPEPFQFQPERWLDSTKINLNQIDPYVYLPFSAGPRNCMGQHLAMLEAKVVIVKFLKKFRYEVKSKEVSFYYGRSGPILVDITSR